MAPTLGDFVEGNSWVFRSQPNREFAGRCSESSQEVKLSGRGLQKIRFDRHRLEGWCTQVITWTLEKPGAPQDALSVNCYSRGCQYWVPIRPNQLQVTTRLFRFEDPYVNLPQKREAGKKNKQVESWARHQGACIVQLSLIIVLQEWYLTIRNGLCKEAL